MPAGSEEATDSAQQGHQRSDWPEANTEEEAFPQGQRALEALQDSCSTPRERAELRLRKKSKSEEEEVEQPPLAQAPENH